jgi:patatin-like phospholipase/acyl hydrolase
MDSKVVAGLIGGAMNTQYTNQYVEQIIKSDSPKKILACDGGGILGIMSVEILAKLESELRIRLGNNGLVLADYFDFVCGTSTGAIIAACISTGMSMDEIRKFYVDSGEEMFDKAFFLNRLKYKYNDESLAQTLKTELNRALGYAGDSRPAMLGDTNLRTLLMMVMRNHTTDSPWPVTNNPYARYNARERVDCNLDLPLWQLVRASTAAPTFFPPEVVTFAEGTDDEYSFVFVDGGVTTYNNPAFLAFQTVTAAPFHINWKTGVDNILIVSVGTGSAANTRFGVEADDLWLLHHVTSVPSALMNAASAGWDASCRLLGQCRFGEVIDAEIGDLVMSDGAASNWMAEKLFSYVRYNPDVTAEGLRDLGLGDIRSSSVRVMDSVKHIAEMQRVGQTYADKYVDLKHLGSFATG